MPITTSTNNPSIAATNQIESVVSNKSKDNTNNNTILATTTFLTNLSVVEA